MYKPQVAIITRTKDRPLFLRRAINSVLHQSYEDWIHIIVNDGGSKQEVEDAVEPYTQNYAERIILIHKDRSHGMEAASNTGINHCESNFILIHDDDDTLEPTFLERTTSYLQQPPHKGIAGVVTLANKIEEHASGSQIITSRSTVFRYLTDCLSIIDVAECNPIPPISFLFKRSAFNTVGAFDESLPVLGDWEFLIRFLIQYDVGVIAEPLANYHVRNSKSGAAANSIRDPLNRFELYETLLRNQFFRDNNHRELGNLLQTMSGSHKLRRLYKHKAIGTFIRLWSRFINSDIPRQP